MLLTKYKFADFVLDVREETLCKNGEPLKIKSRTFQVLDLLLENAGKIVGKEEFFEQIWQGAFVEDNNLTVAVAQVRKILGETEDAKFIETVPRKGYRFVAEVERVFDDAESAESSEDFGDNDLAHNADIPEKPTGAANFTAAENPSEKSAPKTNQTVDAFYSRKILAIVALTAAAFLIAAFWRNSVAPAKTEPLQSIAVLPFSTAAKSPDDQIFAENLTRDLTHNLGRITDLRVAAYEAAAPFDAPDDNLTKIETDLKIDGAVSGEIRTNGAATDIEIKISDLRNGAKVWEKHYSLNAPDLPETQYRIARDVAREIGRDKNSNNALVTANYEAYQMYLTGRHHLGKRTPKDLEKAVENFTQATVKDSSFADAHSALAVAHILQGLDLYAGYGLSASRKSFPAASERAKRALELAPNSDEALAALAFVNYRYEYDWANSEKNFKRAIEINPNNVLAHRWYGEFLHRTGRFDAGLAEQKTALALNPNSARILNEMAWGVYLAHRIDEAVSYAEKAQMIDKTNAAALYNASEIYEQKGDYQKAFALWKEAMTVEAANQKWVKHLEESFQKNGLQGFVRAKTDWLENLTEKDYVYPVDLAKGYTALGENNKAIGWLEKGVESRVPDILSIKHAPAFDSIKADARFQAILVRMNFPN